ncbi:MAG: O-antigen ligase family protein [Bacteroidales bacterium]|nr:O-antigen ligase family protein [Bacteroidales bacterium]
MLKQHIHNQIYSYALLVLAFSIPLYNPLASLSIAVITLNWLVEGRFALKFKLLRSNRLRQSVLLFGLIYLIYLLGFLYAGDINAGLFELQLKLSLLLFPVIFASIDWNILKGKSFRFFLSFIMGCFISSLMLVVRSFINYLSTGHITEFFYGQLSWYHHASYLSMFLVFAIAILLFWIQKGKKVLPRLYTYFLLVYFFSLTFLLSSKAGIICLAGVVTFYTFSWWYRKDWKSGFIFIGLAAIFFVVASLVFTKASGRFTEARQAITEQSQDTAATGSTAVRMLIWSSSLNIIKENLPFGAGTGSSAEFLLDEYKKEGIPAAIENNYNAHNQYLEIFIDLGLPGIFILLGIILISFIISVKYRGGLYFVFISMVAFNLIFESMFERQAGVVFYAFFNVLLLFYTTSEKSDPQFS